MRVIVAGGSGAIGSSLCKSLVERGDEVLNLDILKPIARYESGYEFIQTDLLKALPKKIQDWGAETVYNCVARLPMEKGSKKQYFDINSIPAMRLAEFSLENNVRKYVYLSTSAFYARSPSPLSEESIPNPGETYGRSKLYTEECLLKFRNSNNIDISFIRPRTVIGTGRIGVLSILFDWIEKNQNVYIIGNGSNLFQLISMKDLVSALLLITEGDHFQRDYNMGTSKYTTLRKDLESLILAVGSSSKVVGVPSFIVRVFGDILSPFTPFAPWHYRYLDRDFYFETTRANKELGWKSTQSNREMLQEAYNWYVNNRNTPRSGSVHTSHAKQKLMKWLP
jgi:nucleoside-diphosphate-sugar epimerase